MKVYNNITFEVYDTELQKSVSKKVGVWGIRKANYLRQFHFEKYNSMLSDGSISSYLAEIDQKANEMYKKQIKTSSYKEATKYVYDNLILKIE